LLILLFNLALALFALFLLRRGIGIKS